MKWISILFLFGCGIAKDTYVETKYDLCMKKCDVAYSKYGNEKNDCRRKCADKKYRRN